MDEQERQAIVAAVEAAMTSFEAAERALDAERLIAHFTQVEDFHVYNDGNWKIIYGHADHYQYNVEYRIENNELRSAVF